ncbi:hypothetical protein JAAARDRAFT_34323 [Jaapia argillacea MUCL 33604]|uniref:F-box domain-containing protein n=1 Tax=Jaapia argillacea MUCL 33604 TaxID=933084 RepID=A0A067PUX4_9AGAM|nr:hypothetical protein JAAARDRAFT_34323 [Jaapia argillacea MUCL 33604]
MALLPHLPREIWRDIIEFLPRTQQRECMFVSQFFHSTAIKSLFSTVRIHFGYWFNSHTVSWCMDDGAQKAEAAENARALGLLQYIASNAEFAAVVRKIAVYAYGRSQLFFEQYFLIKALEALPRLQSFHWVGLHHDVPPQVLDMLAERCSTLGELRLPPASMYADVINTILPRFTQLRSLILTSDLEDSLTRIILGPELPTSCFPAIIETLNANHGSLSHLTISGSAALAMPIRSLSELTHLSLWQVDYAEGLDFVFRHTTRLLSLSLHLGFRPDSPIFPVLARSSGDLPILDSFKIHRCSDESLTESQFQALSQFVLPRVRLRRLDIGVAIEWARLLPICFSGSPLTCLEVLGLSSLEVAIMDSAPMAAVSFLPDTLTSLYLMSNAEDTESIVVLLEKINRMSHLRFFYYQNVYGDILSIEDLAINVPTLRIVGQNGRFYTIERSSEGATCRGWAERKVCFRDRGDFEGDDEAWLMDGVDIGEMYHGEFSQDED